MRIPPKDRSTSDRRSLTPRTLGSASDMRAMLLWLISLLILVSVPVSAADKVPVVGWLSMASPEHDKRIGATDAIGKAYLDLGYKEGMVVNEVRYARGDHARYPELVRDLMEHRPAVIVSTCGPALRAIREVSRTIPVVLYCPEPTGFEGEVASLRHPGGQTTGWLSFSPESVGKRLELLKELKPKLSRVAVLYRSYGSGSFYSYWKEMDRVAPLLGITSLKAPFKRPEDLEGAVAAAVQLQAEALMVFPDEITIGARERIAALAIKHRLPTAFDMRRFVDAGGLFSYGSKTNESLQVMVNYIDKILKGTAPGDLPIQQATLFELVVNLRTARALGLSIPQSFLVRADEVLK